MKQHTYTKHTVSETTYTTHVHLLRWLLWQSLLLCCLLLLCLLLLLALFSCKILWTSLVQIFIPWKALQEGQLQLLLVQLITRT